MDISVDMGEFKSRLSELPNLICSPYSTNSWPKRPSYANFMRFSQVFKYSNANFLPFYASFCANFVWWRHMLAIIVGEISSELYRDWLWDGNFKFWLIFTHFNRFSPFSRYTWWNNTWSSLENFSHNSILVFVFLMSQHDNGRFLKIAQRRASISKKTSLCIMVINTDKGSPTQIHVPGIWALPF